MNNGEHSKWLHYVVGIIVLIALAFAKSTDGRLVQNESDHNTMGTQNESDHKDMRQHVSDIKTVLATQTVQFQYLQRDVQKNGTVNESILQQLKKLNGDT